MRKARFFTALILLSLFALVTGLHSCTNGQEEKPLSKDLPLPSEPPPRRDVPPRPPKAPPPMPIEKEIIPSPEESPPEAAMPELPSFFAEAPVEVYQDVSAGVPYLLVDAAPERQKLYLMERASVLCEYPVSTSKYGIGSAAGSNKTPLGWHTIKNKIGADAEKMTIFKGRVNMERKAVIDGDNTEDYVTTRIMWLHGLEPGKNNGEKIDSYKRYIYIHGTPDENLVRLGEPASHGCVRMLNDDVISLFERVPEGTFVNIVDGLSRFIIQGEPSRCE